MARNREGYTRKDTWIEDDLLTSIKAFYPRTPFNTIVNQLLRVHVERKRSHELKKLNLEEDIKDGAGGSE